jgi:hypothetical protein
MTCREEKREAFSSGKKVGFYLGRTFYTNNQLQRAPRVLLEGMAIERGMAGARHQNKQALITYILAHKDILPYYR